MTQEVRQIAAIAVVWLLKEDWNRWLAMDPRFEPDFEYWLRRTEAAIDQVESTGTRCEPVLVDPDQFNRWRRQNGRPVDAPSRAVYAAWLLAQQDERHAAA